MQVRTVLLGMALLAGLTVPLSSRGTVAEQRSRLPPPATCSDPVAGVWKSHQYRPRYRQWTEFKLDVKRVPGSPDALEGIIENHSWYGDADQVQPGPCLGELRYEVSMDARGTIRGDEIAFWGGGESRLDQVLCGEWQGTYYLDHFTGSIDAQIQEFQSVNNDGATAVNEPTVFRRISCEGVSALPEGFEPPPVAPPRSGCLRW